MTMNKRGSGILLHITSLPSRFGIGDMGPQAYGFVDLMAGAGQKYWQVLPLNPTSSEYGNSPYSSVSAFAGNSLLISLEIMVKDGFLKEEDLAHNIKFSDKRVGYPEVTAYKNRLFDKAYDKFRGNKSREDYNKFCVDNAAWLDEFALFVSIKNHLKNEAWASWPVGLRDREPGALRDIKSALFDNIEKEMFLQYLFFKQWAALRDYCNRRGISIIGDIPVYVILNSVDVWAHPDLFKLNESHIPYAVAGVPPDYFSDTGQRWGNPVYRWDVLKETGYGWWIKRIERDLKIFDIVRLDHFRGFVAYWEIDADEETAVKGKWVEAGGYDFFNALQDRFKTLPIIAEDLGVITDDVKEVINHFQFPGMKILLFAFGDDPATNPYAPHNHNKNCVVYTGTHDNNTIKGWFDNELTVDDKNRLFKYIGKEANSAEIHMEFLKLAMMSPADTTILPMQDILGLGKDARMNLPATTKGNWEWRLESGQLEPAVLTNFVELTKKSGR